MEYFTMKKKYFAIGLILISISMFSQTPTTTIPYIQDFEGVTFLPDEWEAFGDSGAAWEHSMSIGAYGTSSSSAYFDNFNTTTGFYGMRCIAFDLSTAIIPTLQVDVAYVRYNSSRSDRFGVWRSFNGTTGWSNIANYSNGTLTTAPDQTTYFTPSNTEWQTITLDLSAFAGLSYVRFAFENNCSNGNTLYIDNVNFFDASPLAVKNETIINFSVYPNPSEGNIILSSNLINLDKNNIQIRNLLGQEYSNFSILKESITTYQLNLENFSSGMYFITVSSDEKSTTKKLYIK
jgi:hypothetical protein